MPVTGQCPVDDILEALPPPGSREVLGDPVLSESKKKVSRPGFDRVATDVQQLLDVAVVSYPPLKVGSVAVQLRQ
jgi:hypothetical protein